MGTPQIAADVLKKLLDRFTGPDREITKEPFELAAVVTQPDKPVGRRQVLTPSPVKTLALQYGYPVLQPKRIKRPIPTQKLKDLKPDLILVTAYGQILSEEILEIPRLGCINVHTSLLPALRGAAPIQWSIVRGMKETGVTLMYMDKGMDTGDIIVQQSVPITKEDTASSLTAKLTRSGALLLSDLTADLLNGKTLPRRRQDPSLATMAPIIQKEDGEIDWDKDAFAADCKVRGFEGWPGAYTYLDGAKLTILESLPVKTQEQGPYKAGDILQEYLEGKHPQLVIKCYQGALKIVRLQLQGKKPMAADAFLRGVRSLPDHVTHS